MKFVIVNDDIDVIRPYWNDFIDYLVVEQNLIVKLGHLFLQKHSPFYNEDINANINGQARVGTSTSHNDQYDESLSSSSDTSDSESSDSPYTSSSDDGARLGYPVLMDSDTKRSQNSNCKGDHESNIDIIYLPLSINSSRLKNANFCSVICIISALVLRCTTMAQVKNKKLARRYDKISIDKNDMQWILLGFSSTTSSWPWFYWTMIDLANRNGGNSVIKCDYVNKMICYLCKHDKMFSSEMIQLLIWICHKNIKSESNLKLMRKILNINDGIQTHRFKMLFDCEPNEPLDLKNFRLTYTIIPGKLYGLMGKSLDVFTLINNLDKQTRKCLPMIECLIETMKENENFRQFINEFRSRTNSRWGKNLDRMVKQWNYALYNDMKNARPVILKWKV